MAIQTFSKRRRAIEPKQRDLVKEAQRFVDGREIPTKTLFRNANRRLHALLRDEGQLEEIVFEHGRRNLAGMSNRELIAHVLHLIDNANTRTLPQLRKEDRYLVETLQGRELLETVIRIARRKGLMD